MIKKTSSMPSWGKRVDSLVKALQTHREVVMVDHHIGPPVDQAEIDVVHQRLSYALDERFLRYFRQHNGLHLRWISGSVEGGGDDPIDRYFWQVEQEVPCGTINIPSLSELFPERMDYRYDREDDFTPGPVDVPILGGWNDLVLRDRLRPLDDFLERPDSSSYYSVALVADERYSDPVCMMTTDYSAALADHNPMRARGYLEMVVATCGSVEGRFIGMPNRGFPDDHPLVEADIDWFTVLGTPEEFLGYLLSQLPSERWQEIHDAVQAISTRIRSL